MEVAKVTNLLLKNMMIEPPVPIVVESLTRQQLRGISHIVRTKPRIRIREWGLQEGAKDPLEDDTLNYIY